MMFVPPNIQYESIASRTNMIENLDIDELLKLSPGNSTELTSDEDVTDAEDDVAFKTEWSLGAVLGREIEKRVQEENKLKELNKAVRKSTIPTASASSLASSRRQSSTCNFSKLILFSLFAIRAEKFVYEFEMLESEVREEDPQPASASDDVNPSPTSSVKKRQLSISSKTVASTPDRGVPLQAQDSNCSPQSDFGVGVGVHRVIPGLPSRRWRT